MIDHIRKNLREVVAVLVLAALGLAVAGYILDHQRLRIPILEEVPFELKAEFETAQAVVPGQGQTIRVAGVRVGDVADVDLEEGVGVVTFAIDRDYVPVYRNATILMRPTTELKDMYFELDPGSSDAGEFEEGETIPLANTAPDVNLDEILASLDADTQAYTRLALVGAGEGLSGRDEDLGELLGGLGPINRKLARLNGEVATRHANLSRLVHNLNLVSGEVGRAEQDLTQLIGAANSAFEAVAAHDPDLRRAVSELPATLAVARRAIGGVGELGAALGPAAEDLRPFARSLPAVDRSLEQLAVATTPVLRDEIRPFVRNSRPLVRDLRPAARKLAEAAPDLNAIGNKVNRVVNMAGYNPRGREEPDAPGRDEGYLFWAAWLAHNGVSIFEGADAHGLYRRFYSTVSCPNAANLLTTTPLAPLVTDLDLLFAAGGPCA
jgi:phospholipid/cholesterol/gamma-HCH transport system substrate-binding protein